MIVTPVTPRPRLLTPRERQVLVMTADGLTAKEIAARLAISRKTVEQHRGRILLKLGVPNQAAAVRLMERAGGPVT
ncbi:MAG TPA: helix-turn-helix transcriptional regulator [Actinomycetota bacterium]|nr:helix-turn-helix transcriptional regulator [Actinomycetota bacterium]